MLDNNIAVPSFSSWASPSLLVDKSDKSPRFCTDYRKVLCFCPDCLYERFKQVRFSYRRWMELIVFNFFNKVFNKVQFLPTELFNNREGSTGLYLGTATF